MATPGYSVARADQIFCQHGRPTHEADIKERSNDALLVRSVMKVGIELTEGRAALRWMTLRHAVY